MKNRGKVGLVVAPVLFFLGTQVDFRTDQNTSAPFSSRQQDSVEEQSVPSARLPDGEEIYQARCMSCHQKKGQGVPRTFPPLQETRWVNGDKGRLVRIILNGLSGPIEVKGSTYQGTMPPWGSALSDEEVAALASYVRSNFGNDAASVAAQEVAQVRAVAKNREQPWTVEELKKETNQGIPGDSTTAE